MLARTAVAGLNHVLAGEAWARERLRHFAGRHVRLAGGPFKLDLAVDGEGLFQCAEAPGLEEPAVTIELPADAPFRLLMDRKSVLAAARLSGAADFAETLAFVFRNLRWDVEEDLSKVMGDIAAHRLVRTGRALFAWQRDAGARLMGNAAEYLSEESGMLAPRRDIGRFQAEVEALQQRTAQLEKRLGTF